MRNLRGAARGLLLVAGSLLGLIAVLCVLIVLEGRRDDAPQVGLGRVGAAVVLGAAQWNGDPSPVLRARLDHALDLYQGGRVRQIILTGGVGPGDATSEADAGRAYLLDRGVAPEALLLEQTGTTTLESLRNTAEIARANRIGAVILVSDPFHMLRALKMARDLGLIAYGSPTRTSPISGNTLEEIRYVVRESWAYLVYLFARE
ncbi:MAG: YdcF family protein [Kouleothrix sp.]|nr:YdcF family protein [Kouleothrix sp.]